MSYLSYLSFFSFCFCYFEENKQDAPFFLQIKHSLSLLSFSFYFGSNYQQKNKNRKTVNN